MSRANKAKHKECLSLKVGRKQVDQGKHAHQEIGWHAWHH